MSTLKIISVTDFCSHYKVNFSFIESLSELDLIKTKVIDNQLHIPIKEIRTIEKLMRLHYDLGINFEGLDVINNLIDQIQSMQEKIQLLENKVAFYKY